MFIVLANSSNEKLNAALIRDAGNRLTYVWSSHYIAIYTEQQTSMIRNTTLVLTNIYWVVLGPTFFSDVSKRFFIAWITINGNKHTQCLRIQNYTGAKFLCIYIVASNYLLIDVIAHSHWGANLYPLQRSVFDVFVLYFVVTANHYTIAIPLLLLT